MKNKKTKIAKITTTVSTALCSVTLAISSAAAAPAVPDGVETESYNTMVGIVFWIVWIILGAIALPGIIGIGRGIADDDTRQRNSGIIATVACAALIGASAVIKNTLF